MTAAQILALRLLAERPRVTTKQTTDGHIAGRVAACLMRMGLATRTHDQLIQITDAGRKALES